MTFQRWLLDMFLNRLIAFGVLLLSVILTVLAYSVITQSLDERSHDRFAFGALRVEHGIKEALMAHENLMWSVVAYLHDRGGASSSNVDSFVSGQGFTQQWPAVQGMGFSAELWSGQMQKSAMLRARDEGRAITLLSMPSMFVVYVPVYLDREVPSFREDRVALHKGWIYSKLNVQAFTQEIIENKDKGIDFTIHEKSIHKDSLLYDSRNDVEPKTEPPDTLVLSHFVTLPEQSWILSFKSNKYFPLSLDNTQRIVFVAYGIFINILLFLLLISLCSAKKYFESTDVISVDNISLSGDEKKVSNRNKTFFLENMSHELRVPMSSIIGFTNMLLKRTKSTLEARDYEALVAMERNGAHLLELIDKILYISRIENKKEEILYSTFSLNDVISEQIETLGGLADKKGLSLDVSKKFEMKDMTTDRTKLTRILNNLIDNAIRNTDKGRVELYVSTFQKKSKDRWFQFEVRDTGTGISSKYLREIFEEFVRVDSFDNIKIEGAGLGLVITKRLVVLLGGEIWVESTEGEGSIFTVSIPSSLRA
ncbi:hypothetical protein A9Q99_04770 [Gammaproteobacteria bacterium 45_16_T64]|nr:hypothetical protein A9Q99_04770 [Gammaproteobacteria bacterium 45_16_T64]